MAGKTSQKTINAVKLAMSGLMSPYAAAKHVGIAVTTLYRNAEYRSWNAAGRSVKRRKVK